MSPEPMIDGRVRRREQSTIETAGSTIACGDATANQFKLVAYNVGPSTLLSLQQALPSWAIQLVPHATLASIAQEGNIPAASLLVLCAHRNAKTTLGLCRGLRELAGRAGPPLLVLLSPKLTGIMQEVLDAGADKCLVLPFRAAEVAAMVSQGRPPPERLPGDLERIQRENRWQDDGGQG